MTRSKITLNEHGGGSIVVNGTDIANAVSAVTITAQGPGRGTTAVVDMGLVEALDVDTDVQVDDRTRIALLALGWTAPGAKISEEPSHLSLGELIARLDREHQANPTKHVRVGFTSPHSYRGYYEQLAFARAENVAVGDMLAAAQTALGRTFQGWKGGDYTMCDYTETWLVPEEGRTGESIGAVLLDLMLAMEVPA
ncbi:hypothetical protein [Amycolatopsis stemonae]